MKFEAFVVITLVLCFHLAFADDHEKAHNEPMEVTTLNQRKGNDLKPATEDIGGYGGAGGWHGIGGGSGGVGGGGGGGVGGGATPGVGGGGAEGGAGGGGDGFNSGYSHGGAYGSGRKCYWGCCSESTGYSHGGGGYYSCKCCMTFAEAKAYKDSKAEAQTKT